jgi:two-component system cell cycle response regulator
MKILVAEDDEGLRQLLKVYLVRGGHEVAEAINGLQAWDLLKQESIRLLIVDWMMPGVDGAELIRRIRAAGWPGYTYIILLTAKSGQDDIITGLNVGADDYLCKPFNREELLARLGVGERILDLEARLSASLAREHELASHDSLTGLLNRRALYERAQAELSRAARMKTVVSLLMIDIDFFKAVNDEYGHLLGDKALCLIADLQGRTSATMITPGAGGARSSSWCCRAPISRRRGWWRRESGRPLRPSLCPWLNRTPCTCM